VTSSANDDDEDWDLEFGVADEIKGHQVRHIYAF
jgi:hypothetical protein